MDRTVKKCAAAPCRASLRFDGSAGWHTLDVRYFDQNNGAARFRLWVGNQMVDEWTAADRIPTQKIDGSSSSRRTISGIALRPGDQIRIDGVPDSGEVAALDYIEIRLDIK
jgi:alpha-glucuronidase